MTPTRAVYHGSKTELHGRNHTITDAYERCADRLEQRLQALELGPPAAPRASHSAATR
ncbi:hypothetical protein [Kitasatospora xanthocidica]|uniref:hypothetical protein n=1 Tax=Kitasatospora xanthocidica TaxID=83382 RepID=UPI0015F3360E|nr:hypothetical protein [Kitasatospora xanthocidica]